jgi:drug/metabolite transporter (DMT)-like permease
MDSLLIVGLPLVAGFIFALGALFSKRGFEEGVGTTRTLFLGNIMMGLIVGPIGFFAGEQPDLAYWWAPLVSAIFFWLGQLFSFLAIKVGDVSVMTPVMGTKVVMVAIGASLFFREPVGLSQWIGAGLTAVAIFLLGMGDFGKTKGTFLSIFFALLASVTYGFNDAMVAAWAPLYGELKFISFSFLYLALFSFGLVPLFRQPLKAITRKALPWVLGGSFLLAFQAMMMGVRLSFFGEATTANIFYSGRGLWSLILVFAVGRYFGLKEAGNGGTVVVWRSAGAVLLTGAILLVLIVP